MKISNIAGLWGVFTTIILSLGMLVFFFLPARWEVAIVSSLAFMLVAFIGLIYVTKKHL